MLPRGPEDYPRRRVRLPGGVLWLVAAGDLWTAGSGLPGSAAKHRSTGTRLEAVELANERTIGRPSGPDVRTGDRCDRRFLSSGTTAQRRAAGFLPRPARLRGDRLHPAGRP